MANETLLRFVMEKGRHSRGVLEFLKWFHGYLLDLIVSSEKQEKNVRNQRIHLGKLLKIVDLSGSTVGLH